QGKVPDFQGWKDCWHENHPDRHDESPYGTANVRKFLRKFGFAETAAKLDFSHLTAPASMDAVDPILGNPTRPP
ncbi:MAG: hypothetical protein OEW39_08475, partial [Deltaproteobacteria bacterium]|nr:hypothetical protein [Deltaproteobacteria bacterium]